MVTAVIAALGFPLVAWLFIARTRRTGWLVGGVLIGWMVVAVLLAREFAYVQLEVTTGYLPGAMAVIWIGRTHESSKLGPAQRRLGIWILRISMAITVTVTCLCGSFVFYVFNSQPFLPSTDELLPLPQGLHATIEEGGRSCGSGACSRRIIVTGRPDQPVNEVEAQVRRHLTRRGWTLDHDGQACRAAGWLLDRTTLCVGVYSSAGAVRVTLEGNRAWA